MTVETELKLRVAPGQLAKLKRHALLKTHQLTRPTTRRFYNIYFDTPKLKLQQAGIALRLRRVGKHWLQTLKGGGTVQGGLHQRNEWEMPVSGPALDFSLAQVEEWKDMLPKHLRNKLQPVFVTDFSRNSRMLMWQGAEIELCMDQGEISTEQKHMPLCELELELKSGEPRQLFELALAILDIVPFELESASKAEQGCRLISGYTEQPLKALPVKLGKHDDLSKVMQTLIWSCMQHLQSNLHGVLAGNNPEYLHQMRVALRRLRVLLNMAERVSRDIHLALFKKEFGTLGIALGKIREWDVFIALTLQPMCERMPENPGLQVLLQVSKQQRDAQYSAFCNVKQNREVQSLLLRVALWMNGPYWRQIEWSGLEIRDFAADYLTRLDSHFRLAGENLEAFDADKLHAMRIRAKKLRYCAEFFSSLYVNHQSDKYIEALIKVQEILGQINDDAMANRLLDDLATGKFLSGHQNALNLCRGWVEHDLTQQLRMLRSTVLSFQKLQHDWRK